MWFNVDKQYYRNLLEVEKETLTGAGLISGLLTYVFQCQQMFHV